MIEHKGTYAVVTGGGQGLGKAFAENLASRGYNLILVALPGDGLSDACKILADKYSIDAVYFETDLTNTESIDQFYEWIAPKYKVSILVNNAGFGGSGEFDASDLGALDKMILLNVRATTWVTHKLLPLLRSNKNSYILNVSSMASFSPIAYKAVYSATKVYVEYLSKGLNKEFKQRGVHVSSVHPGPMRTNAAVNERIERQTRFSRLGVESPDYVAKTALDRMFRRNSIIIIGKGNRLHWALMKTLPRRTVMSLLAYGMKKEIYR